MVKPHILPQILNLFIANYSILTASSSPTAGTTVHLLYYLNIIILDLLVAMQTHTLVRAERWCAVVVVS